MARNNTPVVLVTGAGSGVGRATVLRFAREGWRVALLGRRAEPLRETFALVPDAARERLVAFTCDLADATAVDQTAALVLQRLERVDVLVNAAGTNVPRRSLAELSRADYEQVMAANLHGVLYLVQALLPPMRIRGSGTIINVGSEAGRQASAKSGAPYVLSKFGLTGLTQTINAEERPRGIRACCIFPGDIDTPLLEKRAAPPPPEARTRMLRPEDVADCVWFVANLPERATVEELVIRPTRTN